jgi:hypothetical protein
MKRFATIAAASALTLSVAAPTVAQSADPFETAQSPFVSSQAGGVVSGAIVAGAAALLILAASEAASSDDT